MSEFIPNSFQTPNLYVDQYMSFLTANEWKVLSYAIRRIFGFQKKSDRISINQFCNGIKNKAGDNLDYGTGLGKAAVMSATKSLVDFGLFVIVSEYDKAANLATEYALQLDSKKVNHSKIIDRHASKKSHHKKRASVARKGIKHTPSSDGQNTPSSDGQNTPSSDGQKYNIPGKTSGKTVILSANADQPKNDDPLSVFFGSGNGARSNGNGQARKEGSSAPSKKRSARKPTPYQQATEHLAHVFAEARGLTDDPNFDFDGWFDFSNEKKAKATNKRIRTPLAEIWKRCGQDLEFSEYAVREVVRLMRADDLTFDCPDQIVKTFGSWIADHKAVSIMPYDQGAPADLPDVVQIERL